MNPQENRVVETPDYTIRPALCLDLDGTVRRSKSGKEFISGPDDIEIIPGILDKIKAYKKAGYLIFGVTNQGGIAFGFKTMKQNGSELFTTQSLCDDLFDDITSAISHEKGNVPPFNRRSLLRKPNYGILALCEARADDGDFRNTSIQIDWDHSLFVGDRPEDEQCATSAGVPFCWIADFLS